MTFFDGLNHSIAAVSTGGFSTKANSIAFYDSPSIEIITIVLMFLGNTNFVVHLFLIKGKLKSVIKHIELKFLGIISLIFIPIMVFFVASSYQGDFWVAFRIGLFQFVSGITTTGFQSVDSLLALPNIVIFCVIILMIIGGGIGSTAGGIKQYRIALAIKSFYWNFKDRVTHRNVLRSNYINKFGKVIEAKKQDIVDTNSHITIYLFTLVIGTLIFTAYGNSLQNSLFEFASALGTVGLSVGIISYNSPPLILWTTSFGMFMGRLEFYVVFVAFAKIFMDISKRKVL
jgi:trk system potassium uptake protein TrkH